MNNYDDVWIVPVKAGIEYMRNPVPKDELDFFEPFGCFDLLEYTCFNTRDCRLVYLNDNWYCTTFKMIINNSKSFSNLNHITVLKMTL